MTEVSTTIVVDDEYGGITSNNEKAQLRFVRAQDRSVIVSGALNDRGVDAGLVRVSNEDAIALRDWLNDEFPDEQAERDDYGMSATAAMQKVMREPLWGDDDPASRPWRGCSCAACEAARG